MEMYKSKKIIKLVIAVLCFIMFAVPTVCQVNAEEDAESLVVGTPGMDLEYAYYPVIKNGKQTTSEYITEDVIVVEPVLYASNDAAMEAVISEALSYVKPGMSELEKVLVLHDWLSAHCDYDYINYLKDDIPWVSYNEEGAFVNGKAVCAGYADAFSILMQRVGIESYHVSSSAINHAWNLVYVDGYWHHVDVTWTDPVGGTYDLVNEGYTQHQYFMRSDEEYSGEFGHPGFSDTLPDATLSGSYEGYIFRDTDSKFSYYDSYWYYLENGGYWGRDYNEYITRAKIDGSDSTKIDITGYAYYMHQDGNKLYYNVSDVEIRNQQHKVYCYDMSTGTETLVIDISDTYPGYYIGELAVKNGKLVLVLSDEEETKCRRIVVDPDKLGSVVLADEITFYNKSVTSPIVISGSANGAYTFTSANNSVATVDSYGNITTVGVGATTITVKDASGNVVTTCNVIVADTFFATGVEIEAVPEIIGTKFTTKLSVKAPWSYSKLYNVVWSSSDEKIATVDADGVVTAIAPGMVSITVKDMDSGLSATCSIKIVDTVYITGISLDRSSILINKYGQVEKVNAIIYPENATYKNVKWSLRTSDDCALTGYDNGTERVLEALRDGKATLTATTLEGDYSASCEITVKVTEYEGVDYADVFDFEMYKYYHKDELSSYHNVNNTIKYFVESGMALGHQAIDTFNVDLYKINYPELVTQFGNDNVAYYKHYMNTGKAEGKTAVSGIAIDEVNFPNEVFRNYVREKFDITEGTEGMLTEYEAGCVTVISISGTDVTDLKGIEFFANLETLRCSGTGISVLDISKNIKLSKLECHDTDINGLDISNNTMLRTLSVDIGEVYGCVSHNLSSIKGFDFANASGWNYAVCENNQVKITDPTYGYFSCNYKNSEGRTGTYSFCFDYLASHNYIDGVCTICGAGLTGIEINETNFPDEVFREYVSTKFDTESGTEGVLSAYELDSATTINVARKNISSLKGIEYFTKITELNLHGTGIISVDISKFPALRYLSMDIGDVYGCERYDLSNIKGFDFAKASEWEYAACEDGKIKITDFSEGRVECRYKYATNKSAGYYTFFINYVGDHMFADGTCTKCGTALAGVEINETSFPDEVFREYVLTNIDTESGTTGILTDYEIRKTEDIDVYDMNIGDLTGIEIFSYLQSLSCAKTEITSLDISGNTKLESLQCYGTKLSSLDISKNELLYFVSCYNTGITNIDISKNAVLYELYMDIGEISGCTPCDFSGITGFDLTNTSNWKDAVYENGKVTITNTGRKYISCEYTLESGKTRRFRFYFDYVGDHIFENRVCIRCGAAATGVEIDEVNFPDEVFRNYVSTKFDTGSGTLGILTADEIAAVAEINVNYMEISSLKGLEHFTELKRLYCSSTDITSLDVSKNVKLLYLSCQYTGITNLDVSKNVELERLVCDNTKLTSLDVSNNANLKTLECHNTQIACIDLSNNINLKYFYCYNNKHYVYNVYKTFDLSSIPGFDASRASEWRDATCENGKLIDFTRSGNVANVKYRYDCGNGNTYDFTIVVEFIEVEEEKVEGVTNFVNRMYDIILNREPDAGSETWVELLINGSYTGVQVAEGFIMSDEFLNKDISNEEFVRIMYRAFFNREADEGGLATWKGCLDGGYIKKFVFAGFANSDEFKALCDTYGINSGVINLTLAERTPNLSEQDFNIWQFVERLYSEVMGRNPDQTGMDTWVGVLKSGEYTGAQVAEGFIISDEFLNKDMTNEEYVRIMYRAFFNRDADAVGLETWTGALANGWTKRAVFAGFANSNEFSALCDAYGITQGSVEAE